jgi:hypothetical protein
VWFSRIPSARRVSPAVHAARFCVQTAFRAEERSAECLGGQSRAGRGLVYVKSYPVLAHE